MNIKITIFIFCLLITLPCMGLTKFPEDTCTLEGFLHRQNENHPWLFTVNHQTDSSTTFTITNSVEHKRIKSEGQYLLITIKIPKETFSFQGEAELIKINKLLNPYKEIELYHTTQQVKTHCQH